MTVLNNYNQDLNSLIHEIFDYFSKKDRFTVTDQTFNPLFPNNEKVHIINKFEFADHNFANNLSSFLSSLADNAYIEQLRLYSPEKDLNEIYQAAVESDETIFVNFLPMYTKREDSNFAKLCASKPEWISKNIESIIQQYNSYIHDAVLGRLSYEDGYYCLGPYAKGDDEDMFEDFLALLTPYIGAEPRHDTDKISESFSDDFDEIDEDVDEVFTYRFNEDEYKTIISAMGIKDIASVYLTANNSFSDSVQNRKIGHSFFNAREFEN